MKNLLRILMLVLIIGAVFFAGDFLMNQNENYEFNDETNVEDSVKQESSGEELLESVDEIFSGETDSFSGEADESGEVTENTDEADATISESGDEIVESGEVVNN